MNEIIINIPIYSFFILLVVFPLLLFVQFIITTCLFSQQLSVLFAIYFVTIHYILLDTILYIYFGLRQKYFELVDKRKLRQKCTISIF